MATDCGEYIYSEEYRSYVIKYDGDLEGVNTIVEPDCVNIINSQFLVAYKKIEDFDDAYIYGYNSFPKCFGLMDITVVESVGVSGVRTLPGLELFGKDVLIGFVDTGIDYNNPLFIRANGESKIEAIWDQNEENFTSVENSVFGYGGEYLKEDIERAFASDTPYDIVPTRDENGHGTFLASVAAGNINLEEGFSGIASEASIVAVKLRNVKENMREYMLIPDDVPCYSEDDIILGIKYLIDKANSLNKPIVICLGLGTSQGDHNGSTNLELYIESISGLRGICVVGCTGNELGKAGHFLGEENVSNHEIEISVGDEDKGFVMEVWGRAPSLLELGILSPTGERKGDIGGFGERRTTLSFLYEGTEVVVDNFPVDENTGDSHMVIRFLNPGRGIWTIEVLDALERGLDAWLPIEKFLNSRVSFVRPEPDTTLCSPATGRGIISVGGYNHRNNALYINSGRGFTRDGLIKPDFVTAAVDVRGAFVSSGGASGMLLFTEKSGTSVSASITSGVVALLLEWGLVRGNNPGMSTEVVRQLLIRGCTEVADINYPNKSWGWGALNILESFDAIRSS
ncbi:MAG: peptidase S8 [Lachnospiraceae bacterium]|nr:peptidase S8 [Lachnospiraceae bacterium]